MIFRLDGNVEETLALTPVMREWKYLTDGKVWADTRHPELFVDNPYVDGMVSDKVKGDWFLDFNGVNWQANLRPVSESFAKLLLGKDKLHNWRTIMYHTSDDEHAAHSLVSKGKVAIIADGMSKDIDVFLRQSGYDVFQLSGETCNSWGVFRAAVSMASLYVGFDGNDAAVALTTDTPAVIVYTCRNPAYFAPFRRGIPFEAVVPAREVCDIPDSCLMVNGFYELGKTYGIKCSKKETFCKKELPVVGIIEAVGRILEKA